MSTIDHRPPLAASAYCHPNLGGVYRGTYRSIVLGLVGLCLVGFIAGCGTPGAQPAATHTAGGSGFAQMVYNKMLVVAQCARRHGVPNWPDPVYNPGPTSIGPWWPNDGGVNGLPASTRAACSPVISKLLVYTPQVIQYRLRQGSQNLLLFARCMRAHGFPNWPDPQPVLSWPPFPSVTTRTVSGANAGVYTTAINACAWHLPGGVSGEGGLPVLSGGNSG